MGYLAIQLITSREIQPMSSLTVTVGVKDDLAEREARNKPTDAINYSYY